MFARDIQAQVNKEKASLSRLQKERAWIKNNFKDIPGVVETLNRKEERIRNTLSSLAPALAEAQKAEQERKDAHNVLGRCFLARKENTSMMADGGMEILGFRVIGLYEEEGTLPEHARCQVLTLLNDDAKGYSAVRIEEKFLRLWDIPPDSEERFIDCFDEASFEGWKREGEFATIAITMRMQQYRAIEED